MGKRTQPETKRTPTGKAASSPSEAASPQRSSLNRVLITFCLLVFGVHLLQWTLIPEAWTAAFKGLNASLASAIISLTGIPCVHSGTKIIFATSVWEVVLECTALSAMIVFASFVLVFPARWRSRAIALGIGLPFLFAANLFRLVTLAWIERLLPSNSGNFHDYLWNVAFLFLVILMWLAWLTLVVKHENHTDVPC